jgi:raffinose/stachyose/melibiose transport system permease protein
VVVDAKGEPMNSKSTVDDATSYRTWNPSMVALWVAVGVAALVWMIPMIFMVFTALKSEREIFEGTAYLPPGDIEWDNFREAWNRGVLGTSLFNSAMISLIKVPLGLFVSALGAFGLTRIKFRGRRAMLAVIALGSLLPIQVALAPLFKLMLDLGLLNSRMGIILPYLAFGIPYQVFILAGFLEQIPGELDEAARIDGASNWHLFTRVILPLAKPPMAALFILDFVATWNEYAIASVLLQDKEAWTIPLALQGFSTQFTSFYGPLNSFIIVSILPILVVYLAFQRYFVSGAFSGAIKG